MAVAVAVVGGCDLLGTDRSPPLVLPTLSTPTILPWFLSLSSAFPRGFSTSGIVTAVAVAVAVAVVGSAWTTSRWSISRSSHRVASRIHSSPASPPSSMGLRNMPVGEDGLELGLGSGLRLGLGLAQYACRTWLG